MQQSLNLMLALDRVGSREGRSRELLPFMGLKAKPQQQDPNIRRLSFLLSFPCLTFSYTFCPSFSSFWLSPHFLLSLPACLSCFPFIYQLSVSFQPRTREFAISLDLCNIHHHQHAHNTYTYKYTAVCSDFIVFIL